MKTVHIHELWARDWTRNEGCTLIEAAAVVANAIQAGTGACIKDTLMEADLRRALHLADDECVVFRDGDGA